MIQTFLLKNKSYYKNFKANTRQSRFAVKHIVILPLTMIDYEGNNSSNNDKLMIWPEWLISLWNSVEGKCCSIKKLNETIWFEEAFIRWDCINIMLKCAEQKTDTQQHPHKRRMRGYSQQSFERAVVVGQTPMGAHFLYYFMHNFCKNGSASSINI